MRTKVTAIIPSYFEADHDYLKLCVESLRKTVSWDIIVVTNGTPHHPDLNIHGVTRHLHTKDQGQCNAVNIGAQVVAPDTEYLFVINSDMYFAPGWCNKLRFDYACFSPNLVEPTNNAGSAAPFLKLDGGLTLDEFKPEVVDEFILSQVDANAGEETTGFNLPFFIRKDVWQTIGGYDTKYDPWGSGSDTDLQIKIELAGVQPMRLRDMLVYHFSNKSGTFDGSHQEDWWRNWHYLENKYGFNRDQANSDTWMHQRMVDYGRLQFKPEWMDKYASKE